MMIGIESLIFIGPSYAVAYYVTRYHRGHFGRSRHAIAAAFDACAIAARYHVCIITVLPRPAILYSHRSPIIDKVKTIIAISPGTASAHHIARVFGLIEMKTKAVAVAALAILRNGVVVVIGVTIQHQIIAASGSVHAYTHAIVHIYLFDHAIAAAKECHIYALCMPGLCYLYAYDIKSFSDASSCL